MAEQSKIEILLETAKSAQNIKELRGALKDLVSAQESVDKSSPDFTKLIDGINQTEGRIGDLNDAFKTFAGSGVERLNTSTALLREGFNGLDLDKLKVGLSGLKQLPKALSGEIDGLSAAVGKLKFGNLSASMKELGGSGIGTLTKSLAQLGKAILTNPILLLAAVIVGLIAVVVQFSDKIKPIREIMEVIGKAIDFVIQKLKDFADWLGLTSFAAEEAAQKQIDSAKKTQSAVEERYDTEIKFLQAAGKSTVEVEKKKQEAIRESLLQQINGLVKLGELNGKYSKEQLDQLDELKKAYKSSLVETKVIDIKETKRLADENKKAKDEEAKSLKERGDKYKQYIEDRKKANEDLTNKIEDQQIQLIKNDEEREMAKALLERERAIDTINASKASNELKNAALESQELIYQQNVANIYKKFRDKEAEEKQKAQDAEAARLKEIADNNKAIEEAAAADLLNNAELRIQAAADGSQAELDAKIAKLDAEKQIEMMKYEEGSAERLALEQIFQENKSLLVQQYRDKSLAEDKAMFDASTRIASDATNALIGLSDLVFSIKSANTKKGSAEEEKAARQQFKINKALQISSAVISTITGVVNALSAKWAIPEPFATIGRVANAVAVGLAGAANVAKISATQFESKSAGAAATGGGGSAPSAGGGEGGGAAPAQFSAPQFFGLGQGKGAQSAPQQRVYVLEKDITSTQDKVARVEDRATQKIE